MTRVYCGWCGSASRVSARFCRSCGGEIAAQSGPLSARTQAGAPPAEREAVRSIEDRARRTAPLPGNGSTPQGVQSAQELAPDEYNDGRQLAAQEEQAVQTLRRLRHSGPVLIEEALSRKNQIDRATAQGTVDGQASSERVTSEPAVPASAVAHATTPNADKAEAFELNDDRDLEEGLPRRADKGGVQMAEPLIRPDDDSAARARAKGGGAVPPTNQNASSGPGGTSRVLADASGLQSGIQLSLGVRIGLIVAIVLISSAGYLLLRDRLMATTGIGTDGRELHSPQELSEELIDAGDRATAAGDLAAAVTAYTRSRQLTPNNPKTLFQLAHTYQQLSRIDEALATYIELLRIAPENLEARLRVARIYQSRNNWTDAHREFQWIIALDQNSPESNLALEEIENHEAQLAGQAAVATPRRRRSPKLDIPTLPPPKIGPSEIVLLPPGIPTSKDLAPPDSVVKGELTEQPNPAALVASRKELGLRYLNISEYRAAIKEFLIVLRIDPGDKDVCYYLASAYHGLKMYPEAHEYYKRVDGGRYFEVSQSGAKRTEKAAADQRRRTNQ